MDRDINYTEVIKEFILRNFLFVKEKKIDPDTLLFEKGIIDSTGVIELIAFIEENYNVVVRDEELLLENFSSLNAMENFIRSKNNNGDSK